MLPCRGLKLDMLNIAIDIDLWWETTISWFTYSVLEKTKTIKRRIPGNLKLFIVSRFCKDKSL